ncbi:MAG: STAS domain-containing protein [Bacteroidota bacterium]
MEILTSEDRGVTVLTLKGSIMGGPDALALNEHLHHLVEQGARRIVVDLKAVDAMNSSGLGMLIGGLTTMRNAGGDLKLANASAKIKDLLTITKLLTIFEHYDSTDSAVASFL